jgi:cytoskeletal protein CcmA (bactofilin family)
LSSTGPAARNRTPAAAGNGSDGAQSSIVLGPRDRLVGQLYIEGNLRVVGTVEGGLEVTGSVEIDDGGRVTGPVTAHDRLVVGRSGSLLGDVRVARLVVQDGATFSGKVSMGKQVEALPKPVEPKAVELPAPVKAEEPVKSEAPVVGAEPVQAPEPVKAQPAKAQPVKAQPVKAQPVRAQPAKPQQYQPKPPDRKGKRR